MKEEYTSPKFTVVTVKVENGFIGSAEHIEVFDMLDSYEDNQASSYSDQYWSW